MHTLNKKEQHIGFAIHRNVIIVTHAHAEVSHKDRDNDWGHFTSKLSPWELAIIGILNMTEHQPIVLHIFLVSPLRHLRYSRYH